MQSWLAPTTQSAYGMHIMISRALVFVPLLAILTSCGGDSHPGRQQQTSPQRSSSTAGDQQAGGFGSERDPSRKETYGTLTTKQDSYILRRQTDYKNYARAMMVSSPKQADIDTYEVRVREGRYIPIPAGTKVTKLGTRSFNVNGEICRFFKIEVADGSITDESGMGQRGNVPITAFN